MPRPTGRPPRRSSLARTRPAPAAWHSSSPATRTCSRSYRIRSRQVCAARSGPLTARIPWKNLGIVWSGRPRGKPAQGVRSCQNVPTGRGVAVAQRGKQIQDDRLLRALAGGAVVEAAAQTAGLSKRTANRYLEAPSLCQRLRCRACPRWAHVGRPRESSSEVGPLAANEPRPRGRGLVGDRCGLGVRLRAGRRDRAERTCRARP